MLTNPLLSLISNTSKSQSLPSDALKGLGASHLGDNPNPNPKHSTHKVNCKHRGSRLAWGMAAVNRGCADPPAWGWSVTHIYIVWQCYFLEMTAEESTKKGNTLFRSLKNVYGCIALRSVENYKRTSHTSSCPLASSYCFSSFSYCSIR